MIDNREISAAKLWKEFDEIKNKYNTDDSIFYAVTTFILGCFCLKNGANKIDNYSHPLHQISMETSGFIDELCRPNFNESISNNRYGDSYAKLRFNELEVEINKFFNLPERNIFNNYSDVVIHETIIAIRNSISNELEPIFLFESWYKKNIIKISQQAYRIEQSAIWLAHFLTPNYSNILDYFINSGDLSVIRKNKLGEENCYINPEFLPSPELPLFLRLMLHDISANIFKSISYVKSCTILINNPKQKVSKEDYFYGSDRKPLSSLEAFYKLKSSNILYEKIIMVVPGSDRSKILIRNDKRYEIPVETIRREITNTNLVAVIDLPVTTNTYKKTISIWVLQGGASKNSNILFIDAKKIIKMGKSNDSEGAMNFIASVINAYQNETISSFEKINLDSSSDFLGLFQHEFKNGYRDVNGLCKAVSREEVEKNNWNLIASTYLTDEKSLKIKLPTIDSNLVLDLLTDRLFKPKCIYVIGNNGEGKSLLLSELIEHLSEKSLSTAGISFGLTDRFPLNRKNHENGSSFIYLGARSSEKAMTLKKLKNVVFSNVKEIQTNSIRLIIFQKVFDLLGFNHSLFMIPNRYSISSQDEGSNIFSEIIQLTDDSYTNEELIKKAKVNAFTLGLMRKDSINKIALFEELSSGEQQLLILAIKLISNAEYGMTFLVDEPEISLHVSWQRALPEIFNLISKELKCSIVVATHSPIIVASADHIDDHCFTAVNRTLKPIGESGKRSVETVLLDNFHTYTNNTRRLHERCAEMVSETIKRLNKDNAINSIDDLLIELQKISDLVESYAEKWPNKTVDRDINLIMTTRSAILEVSNQHARIMKN